MGKYDKFPRTSVSREVAFALLRLLSRPFPGYWRLTQYRAALEHRIRKTLITLPKAPVICSTKHGFKVIVHPTLDNGVERSIFQTGTYEEGTLAVFSELLRPGDVVLDVGANIGLMTLHAARLVGKSGEVFCFEPMPDILEQLSLSVELNDVPQVRICPFALGAQPTNLPIYSHPEINRGSSSLVRCEERTPAATVQIVKLDDFVTQNIHKPIRLIKIDVEGWELEVLLGAEKTLSRATAPILCVECSDLHPLQGGTIGDLYTFITRVNDYRCFVLERGKARLSRLVPISHSAQLPHHDNLFCFPLGQPIPALMAPSNGD